MNRLVIIDGNAIMHRAYHALPPLTNSLGAPINAIYGFASMILKVLSDLKPTHIVVTFDRPTPTFRNEIYKEYQSTREAMEDNLVSQIEPVHKLVKDLGIQTFEMDGYEADDLIGTLSVKSAGMDEVVIVSGDRDMLQLVNEKIKVYMPVKGLSESKMFEIKTVIEKYGLNPSQFVEYKILVGDPSDNYPGVLGIGPKTAANLLSKYKTVADLIKNIPQIEESKEFGEKIITALKNSQEQIEICRKLATIVKDAPIELDENKVVWHNNPEKIKEVLLSFGFKTLAKRFGGEKKEIKKENKKDDQLGLF